MNTQSLTEKPNPEAPAERAPSAESSRVPQGGRPGQGRPGVRILAIGGLATVATSWRSWSRGEPCRDCGRKRP